MLKILTRREARKVYLLMQVEALLLCPNLDGQWVCTTLVVILVVEAEHYC